MDNETKYELKLDAKEFIKQLNQIKYALENIGKIVTQQSGKTYAIDVQIKNVDIQRFFDRLDKAMSRAEGQGKSYANVIEQEVGKAFEGTLGKATKAVSGYEGALKTSTKKITSAAKNTADSIADIYKRQDAQLISFMNKSEKKARQSAQSVAASYSKAFRETKKDLESIGVDTSGMSVKDILKFRQDLDKMFNKRQVGQDLTRSFREGWEKSLSGLSERWGQLAEKNATKQARLIEAAAKKEIKEQELAQAKIDKMREAAAEKERQREQRRKLYRQNVSEASRMLVEQVSQENAPEEQKLLSKYNRAVQRIRGIYQSAVEHGRVENPETILAGLTELQQRSLALNNYRLSDQMGINELNEKLKTTVRRFEEMGTRLNKVSSVVQNSVQAFASIQSFAYRITSMFTQFARTTLSRITSQVTSLVKESTEAFKSLEVSMIGFKNFFGEEAADRLYQRIKSIAARAPGLATTDLAEYVRQIAPVSGHNEDLALNASLGMLKTIQYGGASGSTEMEYVIKNIRDVISKGKATAIDVRQFNRAMPILEEVLGSVGQSQLLKDGVLTINKDNVDTILSAFAALNTSNQSAVKDIFSQMNQTLAGQWEQFREQFTTNLMEALRGSQVYGGAQNLLSQLNEGEYINSGLRKLQDALTKFINNINWFKLQRIAGEIWDGMKTIWEGVQDAAENIMKALGRTRSGNVIQSFANWIADLIRGMSDGVVQVIKFVQYLERSGIMNGLSRVIGWFGSIGASLTKILGTMFSHLTNIAGNVFQLVSRYTKLNVKNQLDILTTQLDKIPITARSQVASGADLLYGTGTASSSPEVSAINALSSMVNAHLSKIEMNQTGASTLPKVSYAKNNGKSYFYSEDYQGYEAVGTWNAKTQSWDMHGYSNKGEGAAAYQKLATQNGLQASNSAFLQRVGDNRVVNATIKWMKSAGQKLLSFAQKLLGNIMKGGMVLMLTESISAIVDSLDVFGEATTYVAGVVKTAGYAIAGAMVGSTFGGGVTGGIIGALAGLGVGIASLVQSVKQKTDEIKNTKFEQALDEEQKNIRDSVKDAMIGVGALSANLNERSNEENYALQRLSETIANSSMLELLALDAKGLEDIYLDAKRYKTIQEDFTNKNEGNGFDWSLYTGGRKVTKNDKEYLAKIFDAVNKYDLLASHGYNQAIVDGQRVYVDDNGTPLSAETIWDEFFATQDAQEEVTSEQIDEMQKYLEERERQTEEENRTFKERLENEQQTIIDRLGENNSWSALIHSKLVEANAHLTDIANNTAGELSPENIQEIYGGQTGASAKAWRNATGYPTAWDFLNKGGRIGTGLQTALRTGLATQFGWDTASKNMPAKDYLKGLGNEYNFPNLEIDAVDSFSDEEAERVLNYIKDNGLEGVRQDKVLDKIRDAASSTNNPDDRQKFAAAERYLSNFLMEDDLTNILWWFRWLLNAEKDLESTGLKLFAHGGLLTTPAYRSVGVDTIPAMLSPGEFVVKPSAVKKAGLGMMYALNRGDLSAAARSLAGSVNNNWYRNNNASINNSRSNKTNINNFKIINKNTSARLNSYYSLANRLSF